MRGEDFESVPRPQREQILFLMARCFKHFVGDDWNGYPGPALTPPEAPSGCATYPCTDPVFAKNASGDEPDLWDIQYTPRFGYVPQTNTIPPGGSGTILFNRFRAIYLQRFTLGNSNSIWDAGFNPTSNSVPGNKNTAVEAFYFPDGMLPGGLGSPTAPFEIGVNQFVTLIR